jgi:hypothetical protein
VGLPWPEGNVCALGVTGRLLVGGGVCAQCRVSCRGTGCVGAARLADTLLQPIRVCASGASGPVLDGGCAWEHCSCRVCRGVGAVGLPGGGAVGVFHGPVGGRKDAGAVRGERRVAYVEPAAVVGGCCCC